MAESPRRHGRAVGGVRTVRQRTVTTPAGRLDALDAGARRCVTPLDGETVGTPHAWFLGPKGENVDVLRELILEALDDHVDYRRKFHEEDPERITARIKNSSEYKRAVAQLKKHAKELGRCLRGSVPFFSMRYQGHMLWDQVLPATVGYFSAMLYNQNNVAAEASPVTTRMEIEVGDELCRMLGYRAHDGVAPWGHITADGSIANIEALWAARNAKFFALSLRNALRSEAVLERARGLKIRTLDGAEAELAGIDAWACLNLPLDEVLSLPYAMARLYGVNIEVTQTVLRGHSIQNIGLLTVYDRLRAEPRTVWPPVVIAPATLHYSWPKAATLLGLGDKSLRVVAVDLDARIDLEPLAQALNDALRKREPVIAVVAVIGSTAESAVDPLRALLKLRSEFRARGLDFAVLCDAAWGGYFNSTLRTTSGDVTETAIARSAAHELPMTPYDIEQYQALREADSITVDPHKAGYVPYPAGALCYRNSRMRDLISLSAPVVYHSKLEPTVGIYGIEGSKPGAAAAAVYLAHKVIPANRNGYGRILRECLWVSKRTYCRLVTMDLDPNQRLRVTFLQRLPSERRGEDPAEDKRHIRERFVEKTDKELARYLGENPAEREFFLKLGSDQVILSYSFNFTDRSGVLNRDLERANSLNDRIFAICSLTSDEADLHSKRLFLTSSKVGLEAYGRTFINDFCRRLGVDPIDGVGVNFLITTTMDPWTTQLETAEGAKLVAGGDPPLRDFLAEIEAALRSAGEQALSDLKY